MGEDREEAEEGVISEETMVTTMEEEVVATAHNSLKNKNKCCHAPGKTSQVGANMDHKLVTTIITSNLNNKCYKTHRIINFNQIPRKAARVNSMVLILSRHSKCQDSLTHLE